MTIPTYKPDPKGYGRFLCDLLDDDHCWLTETKWENLENWEQLEFTMIAADFIEIINCFYSADLDIPENIDYIFYELVHPYWFEQQGLVEEVWGNFELWQKESFAEIVHELITLVS